MSQEVQVRFPDGAIRVYEGTETPLSIAEGVSKGLAKSVIGALINGEPGDLSRPISSFGKKGPDEIVDLVLLKKEDDVATTFYRHTMAHIMAQAVERIFGSSNVRLGIGPTIEDGFYYDILLTDGKIKEEDLPLIEKEMKRIIEEDLPLERFELTKDEAIQLMKDQDQTFKVELIQELAEGERITFYRQGEFIDLCRGPHMPSTGKIKHFKLLSLAGAYWHGDEKKPMLQRIYGTVFPSKEALETHLDMLEEAKRRDHRKLGPNLGLFMIQTDTAAGMPTFLPKGVIAIQALLEMWRKMHKEAGYQEVMTPLILHEKLWHQSGHWDHFRENMYFVEKDDQTYAIKPMNCPGHIQIYQNGTVSYRDLPIRMCEIGKVHRYERSGVLHGLFRVRAITQDDAHIFCTTNQMKDELLGVIHLVDRMYRVFGFSYQVELSTRPVDFMGTIDQWDIATQALTDALEEASIPYRVNEGDGAFYGPKIDYHIRDSIGRTWQCATVQLDFQMPQRFDLTYITSNNEEERPVMIHRTVLGALERIFGVLIEHFAGAFPLWLAPTQAVLLPIADRHNEQCYSYKNKLELAGIRAEVDDKPRKISYKIREAQLQKIPYMLVVGDMETKDQTAAVRLRCGTDIGPKPLEEIIEKMTAEIDTYLLSSAFSS